MSPLTTRRRWVFALLAVVLVATAVAVSVIRSYAPERGPLMDPARLLVAEQVCPMDHLSGSDTLVLPGPLTHVPEFHDCQRFIVHHRWMWIASWRAYGPLAAIWVRNRLDTVTFPVSVEGGVPGTADSITGSTGGELAYWVGDNRVAIARPDTGKAAGTALGPVAVPVALVWSSDHYAPLGIAPGYNCLYLFNPTGWKAKMVPVGEEEQLCSGNVDPGNVAGKDLPVVENRVAGRGNADYPPVARWDQGGGAYSAAIKCLAAWCDIGRAQGGPSSAAYAGGRTREIKLWYDEQFLAVHTDKDEQWPTWLLGTVFPDEKLDGYARNGYPQDTWVRVAGTVLRRRTGTQQALDDEMDVYRQKFGFEPPGGTEENTIEFCRGSRERCLPEGERARTCTTQPFGVQGEYWARIVSARPGDTTYRCVTYTKHSGVTLPGVVRWRWVDNDEKTWVPCPSGCCQVDP